MTKTAFHATQSMTNNTMERTHETHIVIKRDGRRVPFQQEKIEGAIKQALSSVYGPRPYHPAFAKEWASHPSLQKDSVEKIQDAVEKLLMEKDQDVAKHYILYRKEREKERMKRADWNQQMKKILLCESIENENANVDEYSFSGRQARSLSYLLKQFARSEMLPEELVQKLENQTLYLHDEDSYAVGLHNCLFADVGKLLREGFKTRNGDVRPANSIRSAMQLVAVIFQIQSQEQFGGVASAHLDYDLSPFVDLSFKKHMVRGLQEHNAAPETLTYKTLNDFIRIPVTLDNEEDLQKHFPRATTYALAMLEEEGKQSAEALYHNLVTLESRSGGQIPFTSINYGRDTSKEGQKVIEWLLHASLNGIGEHHLTPIFPISIFQYKPGVNAHVGDPLYHLKEKAIESLSKRIYPNWVNCNWSQNEDDPNDPDTGMATMGCRTLIGKDIHGMGYKKTGRGNITPMTLNLAKLGLEYGIATGERDVADIEGFFRALDEMLELMGETLANRFAHICSQSPKSAPFMYKNGTIADYDQVHEKGLYEALKHGTNALGYIGVAEMCQALFKQDHADSEEVHAFALSVIQKIDEKAEIFKKRYNLNFSAYATPAESCCHKLMKGLQRQYGKIPHVTDREYLSNSHHVPVWKKVDIFKKLQIEAPFTKYPKGGCITYVELDTTFMNNPSAIEQILAYAFEELDIPYLAFNFPIDTCQDCGYQSEFHETCTSCGSSNITLLRRVTGYLTSDYRNFNKGKQAEVHDRFTHSKEEGNLPC